LDYDPEQLTSTTTTSSSATSATLGNSQCGKGNDNNGLHDERVLVLNKEEFC
jgi:hypothetical protein